MVWIRPVATGGYGTVWMSTGSQVAPGVYICRVEVETEEGRRQRTGVVAVAY